MNQSDALFLNVLLYCLLKNALTHEKIEINSNAIQHNE